MASSTEYTQHTSSSEDSSSEIQHVVIPLPKRKRAETDDRRCAICLSFTKERLVQNPTVKGWTSLQDAMEKMRDSVYLRLKDHASLEESGCTWHQTCLRDYCRKSQRVPERAAVNDMDSEDPCGTEAHDACPYTETRREGRGQTQYDKKTCIYCKNQRCKGDNKLHLVQTLTLNNEIKAAAAFHNDETAVRILGMIDLVAGDALYHNSCNKSYLYDYRNKVRRGEIRTTSYSTASEKNNKAGPHDNFFQSLLSRLQGDLEVLDMDTVRRLYITASNCAVSRREVKRIITGEECLRNVVEFSQPYQKNKPELVYYKNIARSVLVQKIVQLCAKEREGDLEEQLQVPIDNQPSDDAVLYHATRILRRMAKEESTGLKGKGIVLIADSISNYRQYASTK